MDISFGGVFHILSCCIRRRDCKRQDFEYQRLSVFWLQHRQQPVCQEENKNLQSTYSSCTLVIFAAVAQSIHLIFCLVSCHYFSDSGSQVVILGIFWQQRPQSDLPKRGFHLWSRWSKIVSPYSCCPTALQIYPQQRAHNMIQPNTKVCFSQLCFFHKINQCKFGGRATTKT